MNSLRERDKNIINNWYIACLSSELKSNKPYKTTIYDKSYVLFRDAKGKPTTLLNRCLHRLTQLDQGKVTNGELMCPYHGWTYDSDGNVTFIPSEGPNSKPKKMCNTALPTYEQDGVIWVWMGKEKPLQETPPWRFPHWDNNNWVKYFMVTDFDNEVTNLAENFMDVPHTVYVHAGWFRNKSFKKVPMTVKTYQGRVLATYKQKDDKIGGLVHWLLNPKGEPMNHTDEFIYPNITRVDYTFGEQYGFIINSQNTPVSTLKSRTYTYIAYRMAIGSIIAKPFLQFYTRQVIEQDVDIMKIQSDALKIDNTPNFRSTDADALHVAIERLRHWGKIGSEKLYTFEETVEKDFWI